VDTTTPCHPVMTKLVDSDEDTQRHERHEN
jgi:hypothetical protein